jgi:hypothetical protein
MKDKFLMLGLCFVSKWMPPFILPAYVQQAEQLISSLVNLKQLLIMFSYYELDFLKRLTCILVYTESKRRDCRRIACSEGQLVRHADEV